MQFGSESMRVGSGSVLTDCFGVCGSEATCRNKADLAPGFNFRGLVP